MKSKLLCWALVATLLLTAESQAFNAVFTEDFSSVTLGPSVNERVSTIPTFDLDERVASDPDYSPIPNSLATALPLGWSVDKSFDAFGSIDLAYDPFAQGDPAVLDIEEGIAPPVGTVIGNAGLLNQGSAADGVDEWEGWNVANKDFWVEVAGDQQRGLWSGGTGNVAIADPDEYDDLGEGRGDGYYNSGLSTPQISIPTGNNDLLLTFDYSFRAEAFDDSHDVPGSSILGQSLNNSTAQVYVTYDGPNGGTQTVPGTLIDSDGGQGVAGDPDFRAPSPTLGVPAAFDMDDNLVSAGDVDASASVILPTIPAGATNVQLTWGLLNAGNDWWYAIDNIEVQGDVSGSIFVEDFEGVTLGDSINEQIADLPEFAKVTGEKATPDTAPRPDSFTSTAPVGWTVDNSNMPASNLGDDDVGVLEFEGWNFMDLSFWNFADTQDRELFTKSEGAFAVADGDEWDDLNDPTDPPGGLMDTLLESPEIDITGISAGDLVLMFDSSWRDEDDNTAVITVDYGNGPIEVLRWESDDTSPNFHDDNPNETVIVSLDNPDGATTAVLAFQYIGGNDWWWAVDNIQVGVIPEPTSMGLAMLALLGVATRRQK